jgi:hypothetical protein
LYQLTSFFDCGLGQRRLHSRGLRRSTYDLFSVTANFLSVLITNVFRIAEMGSETAQSNAAYILDLRQGYISPTKAESKRSAAEEVPSVSQVREASCLLHPLK